MFYCTYVLLSEKDNKHYIGHTNDLRSQVKKHNDGLVPSTKPRRPLRLVYFEACLSLKGSILREKYFKTGFGRRYLSSRLKK